MSYFQLMNEHQSPEYLIADKLDIKSWETLSTILFDKWVKITIIVCHCYVQELTTLFKSCESTYHFHQEISFQHVYDLNLSVFIFRVLKYFLDCNYFSCFFNLTLINLTKSALTDDLKQINIIWVEHGRSAIHSSLGM